jgi:uncharacterized membrane protein YebE (DUF533 family)
MDSFLKKKLNLLVHLAKIDGKLDKTERQMLLKLLEQNGVTDFDWTENGQVNLDDFANTSAKTELLYLALRIIRADGIIHPAETAYCKELAIKLDFDPEVVDHYSTENLPGLSQFIHEISLRPKAH